MYRVRFQLPSAQYGYYLTEWFDTIEEAHTFWRRADADLIIQAIEDEEGDELDPPKFAQR